MTSEDDLSAEEEVVADSKFCDAVVGGPTGGGICRQFLVCGCVVCLVMVFSGLPPCAGYFR